MQVSQLNMEDFEPESWSAVLGSAAIVVVMSSTYGRGAPPRTATNFLQWLQSNDGEAREVFNGKGAGCRVGGGGCNGAGRG